MLLEYQSRLEVVRDSNVHKIQFSAIQHNPVSESIVYQCNMCVLYIYKNMFLIIAVQNVCEYFLFFINSDSSYWHHISTETCPQNNVDMH